MNVVIMAAGVGSRLGAAGNNQPKCLLSAGGETLIRRSVRVCREHGLIDVSVVTGYRAGLIRRELGRGIAYFHNAHYAATNSLASLWLARDKLAGDVILMNSDLYYDPALLRTLLRLNRPAVMLSDSSRCATADYRLGFDGDRICRHGKALSDQETDGEYVGMARISREFIPRFCDRLAQCVTLGRVNDWWEDVLYSFIPEGLPVYHHDVDGTYWTEVDCPEDYRRLQARVAEERAARSTTHPLATSAAA